MRRATPPDTIPEADIVGTDIERHCNKFQRALEDPDTPLSYWPPARQVQVDVLDGGTSGILLRFCPFCGWEFPPPLGARRLAELGHLLGIDPFEDEVPPPYRTDEWWRTNPDLCAQAAQAPRTDPSWPSIFDDVLVHAVESLLSPQDILEITEYRGVSSPDDRQAMAIGIASRLLLDGLAIPGDRPDLDLVPWPGSTPELVGRVLRRWAEIGPDLATREVCDLELTDEGERRGKDLLVRYMNTGYAPS